jgi:hypothetical protein
MNQELPLSAKISPYRFMAVRMICTSQEKGPTSKEDL